VLAKPEYLSAKPATARSLSVLSVEPTPNVSKSSSTKTTTSASFFKSNLKDCPNTESLDAQSESDTLPRKIPTNPSRPNQSTQETLTNHERTTIQSIRWRTTLVVDTNTDTHPRKVLGNTTVWPDSRKTLSTFQRTRPLEKLDKRRIHSSL